MAFRFVLASFKIAMDSSIKASLSKLERLIVILTLIVGCVVVPLYSLFPVSPPPAKLSQSTSHFETVFRNAVNGDVLAQRELGFMYDRGEGVKQNLPESMKWHLKAAQGGDPYSQAYVGYRTEEGWLVKQNYSTALAWYLIAAEQGNSFAQCAAGRLYEMGRGTTENDSEASRWYTKAAGQNSSKAQYRLGMMHHRNCLRFRSRPALEVRPNEDDSVCKQAYVWLSVAAANGYDHANSDRDFIGVFLSPNELGTAQIEAKVLFEEIQRRNLSRSDLTRRAQTPNGLTME